MITIPDNNQSFWREAYPKALYPNLKSDITVDVIVVGAGITGLTTAYLLKRAGLTVAVIEKDTVGGGTTGRTTGKVTSQHNLIYAELQERLGKDTARIYGEANEAAIKQIEQIITAEQIDCDWVREDNYVFTADPKEVDKLKDEATIAASLGLPASFVTEAPLPFAIEGAVKFTNQAKFSSQKYLIGLVKAIDGGGSYVFENSEAVSIKDGEAPKVSTKNGSVTGKYVVVATSVPTAPLVARGSYALLEYPKESYIVAGKLDHDIAGMYISPDKDHYSILPVEMNGERRLLIGGEGHMLGKPVIKKNHYEKLAKYAEEKFGITEITHAWSDRDYLSYDSMPLIGFLYASSKNMFVGTAFMKWGMTNGTVAGMILTDLITGKPNPWAATFDSTRKKPIESIPHAMIKNITSND